MSEKENNPIDREVVPKKPQLPKDKYKATCPIIPVDVSRYPVNMAGYKADRTHNRVVRWVIRQVVFENMLAKKE
ncbi:MAG: hypothetical protein AB2689_21740 [Candidatus Thiodiazotropha taylori]